MIPNSKRNNCYAEYNRPQGNPHALASSDRDAIIGSDTRSPVQESLIALPQLFPTEGVVHKCAESYAVSEELDWCDGDVPDQDGAYDEEDVLEDA